MENKKKCPCCGGAVYAKGLCQFKYWESKRSPIKKKPPTLLIETGQKMDKELASWFSTQISMMPSCCENCDEFLNRYAPWGAKAYIAHIVPKSKFDSVKVHPLNRIFLCIQCHTNYDQKGWDFVATMKIFPIAISRFTRFAHLINTPEEYRRLPEYFAKIVDEKGGC